jgi:hypothetical protein
MFNNSNYIQNKNENEKEKEKEREKENKKTIVIDETSICIPRVLKHISNDFIVDLFQNKICLGIVKRVDIVLNNNNNQFNKVFIHFESWHNHEIATSVKNKLLHDTTIKIVYNYPWFWKCILNKHERKIL